MYAVAVDLDGVVHKYSKGYQDGSLYDDPIEGAFEALGELMQKYAVYIHSTRDPKQMQEWFFKHKFPFPTHIIEDDVVFYNKEKVLGLTQRKIPALAYVDDRGVRFTGDWNATLKYLGEIL